MPSKPMAVRVNLPTVLAAALALAGTAGCETEDDPLVRAQVGGSQLDASVDDGGTAASDAGAGSDADAGGSDAGGSAADAGTRIIAAAANGTGCPAGSALATIAPDGQSVAVTLTEFTLEVSPQASVSVKDCQVSVAVNTGAGEQYQLTRTSARGAAKLEQGVSARVQIDRYFQGNPAGGEESRTDLLGPRDERLALGDTTSALWSPCGVQRDLNVRFTARLVNSTDTPRRGSLALDEVQVLTLTKRACQK